MASVAATHDFVQDILPAHLHTRHVNYTRNLSILWNEVRQLQNLLGVLARKELSLQAAITYCAGADPAKKGGGGGGGSVLVSRGCKTM